MSGPMASYVYVGDDGTSYKVKLPGWEATITNTASAVLQGLTAPTTEPQLPRGIRRRKRYYRITATGREGSLTVLKTNSAIWTDPDGTGVIVPLFAATPPTTNNATLQGATGERRKAIG
jgi:hypothetical protein